MTHDAYASHDPRVLVVDDDELTRYVVGRRLRQWGYDPRVFAQPRQALQFLKEGSSSALVTDMYMPETTGLALARAVRLVRPRMPIVLMTGNPDPDLYERARAHGIGEVVLKKPGSHEELRAALRRAIAAGEGPPPSPSPHDIELAHSLRTPLTALKSAIDIMCNDGLPDGPQRLAGIAQRNVDQMIVLIERLLERSTARH